MLQAYVKPNLDTRSPVDTRRCSLPSTSRLLPHTNLLHRACTRPHHLCCTYPSDKWTQFRWLILPRRRIRAHTHRCRALLLVWAAIQTYRLDSLCKTLHLVHCTCLPSTSIALLQQNRVDSCSQPCNYPYSLTCFAQASHSDRHYMDQCTTSQLSQLRTHTDQRRTDHCTKRLTDPLRRRTSPRHTVCTIPHQQRCTIQTDKSMTYHSWTQKGTHTQRCTVRYTMQT